MRLGKKENVMFFSYHDKKSISMDSNEIFFHFLFS